ncbi:MAG: radical SAM protein [Clostridia bacterium BRH_c25]|nr:MAG: radical SAM protein [Clostridia bacterium BRH_c25]
MNTILKNCKICPIQCGSNRYVAKGVCGAGAEVLAARAFLHQWEEPCISGKMGSGTIFFSSCNMKCIFCQNHVISQENFGKEITVEGLTEIMLELQEQGAVNINLVSPTPYALHIVEAAASAKRKGLSVPIIYNTNGYETIETIEMLKGTIDIYLPDIKYYSDTYAVKYSESKNYFGYASKAVLAMYEQVGHPVFDDGGIMQKGVLIRHLILPELLNDSKIILRWIKDTLGEQAYVSLMCQYTPMFNAGKHEEINRKLEGWEYDLIIDYFFKLGLENGFVQEHSSATGDYVPDFDLSGI